MGNCIVTVHVSGQHHNGHPRDIDNLSAKFVDLLKANGHLVTAATVNYGGEQDLLNDLQRWAISGEGR